jgi:hypothetical protein
MEYLVAFVLGGAVVGAFFYWRGHKQKIKDQIANIRNKSK